ncbi:hypothetical protein M0804_002858 [Polistes exclamans]|nr:hypothetical protein M0804_002858 [Polistes exclamans]
MPWHVKLMQPRYPSVGWLVGWLVGSSSSLPRPQNNAAVSGPATDQEGDGEEKGGGGSGGRGGRGGGGGGGGGG